MTLWVGTPHGNSHHPAQFGGHRNCGSGDMMFLVVEGQDSTCPRLKPPLNVYSERTWHAVHKIISPFIQ